MSVEVILLLAGAGIAGGIVNAIAGGAILITFPAMLAAGLPPIAANASSAVAVTPGHLFAGIADRSQLPPWRSVAILTLLAVLGGGAGAILLLVTPERLFVLIVPALIALATAVFLFGRSIQQSLSRRMFDSNNRIRYALLAPTAAYGGYFGAGLGIMLLAILSITGAENIRAANALKNFLATATSFASITIFALQGVIRWPETLIVLAGAVCGGIIGGRLVAVLPVSLVRGIVVALGVVMTVVYAWRFWFQ